MTGPAPSEAPDWDAVAGALALGLGRGSLPAAPGLGIGALEEASRPLALLALLAQRRRLAAPDGPEGPITAPEWPEDPRPMAPPAARETLARLDRRLDGTWRGILAPTLLGVLAARGYRPHRFDLPGLEPMLRQGGDSLGPVEAAWLAAGRGGVAPAPSEADTVEDTDAAALLRLPEFRDLRRRDPDGGREALAAAAAKLPAKTRAELTQALSIGLSPADRELLESLGADRARAVREAAEGLLSKLPGSSAYESRLAAARRCIGAESTGLLRKRMRIQYLPPVGVADAGAGLFALFEGFTLSALLEGLGIDREALATAAGGAQALLRPLARAALHDGDVAGALLLLAQLSDPAWPGDLVTLNFDPARLGAADRRAALEGSFSPKSALSQPPNLPPVLRWLSGPLDEAFARRLMGARCWTDRLGEIANKPDSEPKADVDGALLAMTAIMPPSLAGALTAQLEPIPAVWRPRTAALLAYYGEVARLPPAIPAPLLTP